MMIYNDIAGLVQQAIQTELIEVIDARYTRNQVMQLLQLDSFPDSIAETTDSIPNLLEKIVQYAVENEVIEDTFDQKDILSASIMNCFVARPSVVQHTFYEKYAQSAEAATDYFYALSKNSNYIQMKQIAKNIHYKADTAYGKLDITINLSKPEKDPEQIKRERESKQHAVQYPKCVLCVENEGYAGRINHPARANHRVINVPLFDENWYLQYSPYVYYNEHSILLSEEHRNMKIDRNAFARLVEFTAKFPHYFIGSNADLPIVGGSILSHDHYQAGCYEFAMTNAENAFSFSLQGFPGVEAAVLKWPLSVIRLQSKSKDQIIHAAGHILETWKSYDDANADIIAFTEETPHNTVTPIARRRGQQYELDLVLRNNRTTEAHPLGIFHPHEDVHHIKKENIGLIEVMGLAVLPARLKDELATIKQYLLNQPVTVAAYHQAWAEQMKAKYTPSTIEEAGEIVEKELGLKFARVLEDAGVFKQTNEGIKAFKRFIQTL